MAIQRAAALPAPASEIARARDTLARQYGGMVWDGPDRRVLFVRVPRADPDPVNDVEAAVEYLRPDDAKDITHCMLVGDDAVAQVYARPLQELMRQREQFDDRTAAAWRERLPGTLAHVLFQSPEDPRRRWRLAVRIPAGSVAELDERMLEELAEGIGPELDTSRMKQVCAVYLIASHDAVRLESDMFIEQMRAAWTDEDRRRRAELAQAQRRDAERRQKEVERRRIVAEMERRLAWDAGRRRGEGPAGAVQREGADAFRAASAGSAVPGPVLGPDASAGGLEADRRDRRTEPAGQAIPLQRQAIPVQRQAPPSQPLAEATSTITTRLRQGPSGPWALDADDALFGLVDAAQEQDGQQAAAVDKLDELRQRVERAMQAAPQEARPRVRTTRTAPERRHEKAAIDRALSRVASRRLTRPDASTAGGDASTAGGDAATAGRDAVAAAGDAVAMQHHDTPAAGPATGADAEAGEATPARPGSPRLASTRALLEDAGFEVIESPSTQHAIDLAAERPEGDPQRVVVRVVERLDPDVAKGLLQTARELDVDLVLCVADSVDAEGKRLLVATKIKVVDPAQLSQMRF